MTGRPRIESRVPLVGRVDGRGLPGVRLETSAGGFPSIAERVTSGTRTTAVAKPRFGRPVIAGELDLFVEAARSA